MTRRPSLLSAALFLCVPFCSQAQPADAGAAFLQTLQQIIASSKDHWKLLNLPAGYRAQGVSAESVELPGAGGDIVMPIAGPAWHAGEIRYRLFHSAPEAAQWMESGPASLSASLRESVTESASIHAEPAFGEHPQRFLCVSMVSKSFLATVQVTCISLKKDRSKVAVIASVVLRNSRQTDWRAVAAGLLDSAITENAGAGDFYDFVSAKIDRMFLTKLQTLPSPVPAKPPETTPRTFGIHWGALTGLDRRILKISDDRGAKVESVDPGSFAALIGLQPGDVIRLVNGAFVSSPADVNRIRDALPTGSTVTFEVLRPRNIDGLDLDPKHLKISGRFSP